MNRSFKTAHIILYRMQFTATEQPVVVRAATAVKGKWHLSVPDWTALLIRQHAKYVMKIQVPSPELCEI